MRTIAALIFIIACFTGSSQTNKDLLVFNSVGDIYIKRGKQLIPKPQADILLAGDFIIVNSGTITIINSLNKRISLDNPRTYSYSEISDMLDKENASLTNRYFLNVWRIMNRAKGQSDSTKTGSVVRAYGSDGNDSVLCLKIFPADSAVLITDRFCIIFENPVNVEYKLSITTENNEMLREYQSTDTLFIVRTTDINRGKPGIYFWKISPDSEFFSAKRALIIPNKKEREALFSEFLKNYEVFSRYEKEIALLLLIDYFAVNKVYVCVKQI